MGRKMMQMGPENTLCRLVTTNPVVFFLFRQGALVAQTQATLDILRAGVGFKDYEAAYSRSILFGLLCRPAGKSFIQEGLG